MSLVSKLTEIISGTSKVEENKVEEVKPEQKSTGRTSHYYVYIKDKNGKRTGQTLCLMAHDGKVFHGMSTCSKEDQFNKDTGRKIALIRAQGSVQRYEARKLKGLK